MEKMQWFVFRNDSNAKKIERYNVFKHYSFATDVKKLLCEVTNKLEFSDKLKRIVQYYFWSKCEMEVVVASWPIYITLDGYDDITNDLNTYEKQYGKKPRVLNVSPEIGEKIDIYEQLMLNWDVFVNYIWEKKGDYEV